MLPTPCTSHVSFDTIYEPSEDSYLFLDTLSSPTESAWLSHRFSPSTQQKQTLLPSPSPLVLEVGCGSGVVLAFAAANSQLIFGRRDIITLATDVNRNACIATKETVSKAIHDQQLKPNSQKQANKSADDNGQTSSKQEEEEQGAEVADGNNQNQPERDNTFTVPLTPLTADLCTPLRPGSVDVLIFNPPYVPTEELPELAPASVYQGQGQHTEEGEETKLSRSAKFEQDSYFLSLTYAGGRDGMETTERLLEMIPEVLNPERGVAYVLLCAQNRPAEVMERVRAWQERGGGWRAESVGNSGVQAGWEKLVIVRIWRE